MLVDITNANSLNLTALLKGVLGSFHYNVKKIKKGVINNNGLILNWNIKSALK